MGERCTICRDGLYRTGNVVRHPLLCGGLVDCALPSSQLPLLREYKFWTHQNFCSRVRAKTKLAIPHPRPPHPLHVQPSPHHPNEYGPVQSSRCSKGLLAITIPHVSDADNIMRRRLNPTSTQPSLPAMLSTRTHLSTFLRLRSSTRTSTCSSNPTRPRLLGSSLRERSPSTAPRQS